MIPIETVYDGYRFRSRLEAKWACFFDAAKIRYVYEPEGYELGEGKRYLPDFYLPDVRTRRDERKGVYIEVKGVMSDYDKERIRLFAYGGKEGGDIKNKIVIIGNVPTSRKDAECALEGYWDSALVDGGNDRLTFGKNDKEDIILGCETDLDYDLDYKWFDDIFSAARGARFEHGESGIRAVDLPPKHKVVIRRDKTKIKRVLPRNKKDRGKPKNQSVRAASVGTMTINGKSFPAVINVSVMIEMELSGITLDGILSEETVRWKKLVCLVTIIINTGLRLTGSEERVSEDDVADAIAISDLADITTQLSMLLGGEKDGKRSHGVCEASPVRDSSAFGA